MIRNRADGYLVTRSRVLVGMLLLAAAVGQYAIASRDFLDTSQRGLFSLRLGDCFDAPEGTDIIGGVQVTDCSNVHGFEVFGFGEVPDAAEFDAAAVAAAADAICIPEFERYVGVAATESQLSIMHLSPTLGSWGSEDRSVTCLLFNPSGRLRNSMIRSGV
jgi:hypothetical protein